MNRISSFPHQMSVENLHGDDTVVPDNEQLEQIRQALNTGWRSVQEKSRISTQVQRPTAKTLQSSASTPIQPEDDSFEELPIQSPQTTRRGAIKLRVKPVRRETPKSQTMVKVQDYFANIFFNIGSVRQVLSRECTNISGPQAKSVAGSSRRTVQDLRELFTYFVSEKEQTVKRIAQTYEEAARSVAKNTLTLPEKMSRIATYIGALRVILEANVCHGDLKPENILWDDTSFVISDFNGAIKIDMVCQKMNKNFRFENEADKKRMKVVVQALCANTNTASGLQNASTHHPEQIKKLVDWQILHASALKSPVSDAVVNVPKLHQLNIYLGTRFLPDSSTGYASDEYRNAMCDYFWQCDEGNFKKACQAFDIRAAGLTIYSILTGARTPAHSTSEGYYDKLEHSLTELKIPKRAISIIRRMAEPIVREENQQFILPVSTAELEELEQLLQGGVQVIRKPIADPNSQANLKYSAKLELIQNSLARLSFSEGDEDEKPSKDKVLQRLLTAVPDEQVQMLAGKLSLEDRIDSQTRKQIIEQALLHYPNSSEGVALVDDKKYSTLVLLDEKNPETCDVVVTKEELGQGGSAIAYKALSLHSLTYLVIRFCQALADPREAEHAHKVLSDIGQHKGVQRPAKLFTIYTHEGKKNVEVDTYYKNCDYGIAVHGELLCSSLQISREKWGYFEEIYETFKALNADLQEFFMSNKTKEEKTSRLKAFIDEYGSNLMAVLGVKKAQQLFEDYHTLIDEATVEEANSKNKDGGKKTPGPLRKVEPSTSGLQKLKHATAFVVNKFRTSGSSSPKFSRQSSQNSLDESHSWATVERDLVKEEPNQFDKTYELVNMTALAALVGDSCYTIDERQEILEQAKQTVLQAIRKCQREIFLAALTANEALVKSEDPIRVIKSWNKVTESLGEDYLDVAGINHIAKCIQISVKVLVDENSTNQKTLQQLLIHKTRVWEVLSQYSAK